VIAGDILLYVVIILVIIESIYIRIRIRNQMIQMSQMEILRQNDGISVNPQISNQI